MRNRLSIVKGEGKEGTEGVTPATTSARARRS